jgi:hypothetical protein
MPANDQCHSASLDHTHTRAKIEKEDTNEICPLELYSHLHTPTPHLHPRLARATALRSELARRLARARKQAEHADNFRRTSEVFDAVASVNVSVKWNDDA